MNRPLPWYVQRPFDGCGDDEGTGSDHMQYSIWDADGNLICECDGDDEGCEEAITIVTAVNRAGPKVCASCDAPATCFGAYEDGLQPSYSCDECCGHGNEDGHCEEVTPRERLQVVK